MCFRTPSHPSHTANPTISPTPIHRPCRHHSATSAISIAFRNDIQDACTRVSWGARDIFSDRGLSLWANSISGPNQIPCAAFTYIHRTRNPKSLCERYILSRGVLRSMLYTYNNMYNTRTRRIGHFVHRTVIARYPSSICHVMYIYIYIYYYVYNTRVCSHRRPCPLLTNEFPKC